MSEEGLRPVGAGLERLLRDLGMPEHLDVTALVDEWPEVAAGHFADLSVPASYGSGVLVVEVEDGAAASLLKYHSGDLVERLDERYGKGAVTSVRIRVRGPKKGR